MVITYCVICFYPKVGKAETINLPEPELYPGMRAAVAETLHPRLQLAEALKVFPDDEVGPSVKKIYCSRIHIGGFSHHDTGNMPNTNHENNFGLGGAVCGEYSLFGIHPTAQVMHIFVNSKKGTTTIYALGGEAILIEGKYVDLGASLSRAYVRATDAKRGKAVHGWATMPSVFLESGRVRLNFTPLGTKVYYIYISIGF